MWGSVLICGKRHSVFGNDGISGCFHMNQEKNYSVSCSWKLFSNEISETLTRFLILFFIAEISHSIYHANLCFAFPRKKYNI